MVVEDNPMNMELVLFVLQSNGMEVAQAVDRTKALELTKGYRKAFAGNVISIMYKAC
ncbi:hypothetical protein [Methanomethylovorans sp.]|uniref:hypothetical protein n=1 Tax=Methanomethylovorans sp. TaxID=2758717 RepID=UPI001BD4B31B|nr:hypothetical protein [Methanomethylovorans sp.]